MRLAAKSWSARRRARVTTLVDLGPQAGVLVAARLSAAAPRKAEHCSVGGHWVLFRAGLAESAHFAQAAQAAESNKLGVLLSLLSRPARTHLSTRLGFGVTKS